jgi:uncharacterized membrane protein HdeD (DUF308 family)
MTEKPVPTWVRVTDILLGIIAILASILVILNTALAIQILIFSIGVGLAVLGFARILRGMFSKVLSDPIRALNVAAGLVIAIVALVPLLFPALVVQLILLSLAFVLLLVGIVRLVNGGFGKALPTWLRGVLVVLGIFTIAFALGVFLFPALGEATLALLLALGLLTTGLGRILKGISGIPEIQ